MFEEPQDEPQSRRFDPAERAAAKVAEIRMHSELYAVFEGVRKFNAKLRPDLSAELARECQQTIGKLEKARLTDSPLIIDAAWPQALRLLEFADINKLSMSDYHIRRRPGEAVIVRWLEAEDVERFYARIQAHFDAALTATREEERAASGWKHDAPTMAYLDALDRVQVSMADRYLREMIRQHGIFVLSTQAADEMDIQHLCDFVMGVDAEAVVGAASAPGESPTERERAWFFKLFCLRGMSQTRERMMFFAYLQKTDEDSFE